MINFGLLTAWMGIGVLALVGILFLFYTNITLKVGRRIYGDKMRIQGILHDDMTPSERVFVLRAVSVFPLFMAALGIYALLFGTPRP
jgi:hypothetical protein